MNNDYTTACFLHNAKIIRFFPMREYFVIMVIMLKKRNFINLSRESTGEIDTRYSVNNIFLHNIIKNKSQNPLCGE